MTVLLDSNNDSPAPPRKRSFHLSRNNKIFFAIIILYYTGLFLLRRDWSPEALGFTVGTIIGFLLFSTLIALLIWGITKGSAKATHWTFSIVLILFLLANYNLPQKESQSIQDEHKFNQMVQRMKRDVRESVLDPNYQGKDINIHLDEMLDTLDHLADSRQGIDKKQLQVARIYLAELHEISKKWDEAYELFSETPILDLSQLESKEDLSNWLTITNNFESSSRNFLQYYQNSENRNEQLLRIYGLDKINIHKYMESFRKGLRQDGLFPIVVQRFQAYTSYGEKLSSILLLLEKNWNGWEYDEETEEIQFAEDKIAGQYDSLIEVVISLEEQIESIDNKLIANIENDY